MKQKQRGKPSVNVLLVMDDTALVTGIKSALSKKRSLQINWHVPEGSDLAREIRRGKPKVVIFNPAACSLQSSECLISLFSSPNVTEVLMINHENNLVQVFKKQKIMLTDKQDFTKLF